MNVGRLVMLGIVEAMKKYLMEKMCNFVVSCFVVNKFDFV